VHEGSDHKRNERSERNLTDAEKGEANLVCEDALSDNVTQNLCVRKKGTTCINGDITEGIKTKFNVV